MNQSVTIYINPFLSKVTMIQIQLQIIEMIFVIYKLIKIGEKWIEYLIQCRNFSLSAVLRDGGLN